jgi:hypothetical protein
MTNSNYDTRHRVTLNGLYDLPFGTGRKFMHQGGVLDYLVGGWSASATWASANRHSVHGWYRRRQWICTGQRI